MGLDSLFTIDRSSSIGVFLDRDGVIIEGAREGEYITDWENVRFLPGALASVAALYDEGFKVVIVTNQRGVALGKIHADRLNDIHSCMRARFAEYGAVVAGIYFCPHDKSENCSCRKPAAGMLLRAAEEHSLDLGRCWMVGDKPSDIEAGKRVGCRTILIRPCHTDQTNGTESDFVVADLRSAAHHILESARLSSRR